MIANQTVERRKVPPCDPNLSFRCGKSVWTEITVAAMQTRIEYLEKTVVKLSVDLALTRQSLDKAKAAI